MAATKQTTLCIVQWKDGDDTRVSVAGWDGCPHQKDMMRKQASAGIDPNAIESVRFVEMYIPVIETNLGVLH